MTATMEELGMEMPKPTVDIELIRKQYHRAKAEEKAGRHKHKKKK